jgi:uncharacterized protein YndB with AHSA1/START domain
MSVTKEIADGRATLRLERRLAHSVERVWRAVTKPAELERWFVAPVEWGPELGETWEALGQRGEITRLEPPHVIEWIWGDEQYSFELSADRDGCLLVFTHAFPQTELADQHARGWEIYFTRLDVHLAGGFLSEEDAHAQARAAG